MKKDRWRLDEFIPCLDLYLRRGAIGENDSQVQAVAKIIGRSPAAVALRLGNFQFVDPQRTGAGLDGGAKQCKQIWDTLASKPDLVAQLAGVVADLSG